MACRACPIVLVVAALAAGSPVHAQEAGPGPRSLSVMGGTFGGAFDAEENTPLIETRYRIGVTRVSAAEFVLGVGRLNDSGCLTAVSDGSFGSCSSDSRTLVTAGLTQGLYAPAGRIRPYVLGGIGTAIVSDYGFAVFGVVGGGLALHVIDRLATRAEVGRRFNGDGGATHFLAGLQLLVRS